MDTIKLPAPGDHSQSHENVGEGFEKAYEVAEGLDWIRVQVVEGAGSVGPGHIEIKGGGYVRDARAQDLNLYMQAPVTFTVKHVPGSGEVGAVQVMYHDAKDENGPKLASRQRKA